MAKQTTTATTSPVATRKRMVTGIVLLVDRPVDVRPVRDRARSPARPPPSA